MHHRNKINKQTHCWNWKRNPIIKHVDKAHIENVNIIWKKKIVSVVRDFIGLFINKYIECVWHNPSTGPWTNEYFFFGLSTISCDCQTKIINDAWNFAIRRYWTCPIQYQRYQKEILITDGHIFYARSKQYQI